MLKHKKYIKSANIDANQWKMYKGMVFSSLVASEIGNVKNYNGIKIY